MKRPSMLFKNVRKPLRFKSVPSPAVKPKEKVHLCTFQSDRSVINRPKLANGCFDNLQDCLGRDKIVPNAINTFESASHIII